MAAGAARALWRGNVQVSFARARQDEASSCDLHGCDCNDGVGGLRGVGWKSREVSAVRGGRRASVYRLRFDPGNCEVSVSLARVERADYGHLLRGAIVDCSVDLIQVGL